MGFDTKTVRELELLASHLHQQVALHPEFRLERVMLRDCEKWLTIRRKEMEQVQVRGPRELSKQRKAAR